MDRPNNGFEFLEELRKRSGKPVLSFRPLSLYLDDKAREKGVPLHGQFELTPLCNFSCKMCYVHLDTKQLEGNGILSVTTWMDLMHQAWENGMMHATLTGGECLAYPGFEELFRYLHSLGCTVTVLTNGYLLDKKWVDFFREHVPARIQITLYGWNNDVYERVTGQRAFSMVTENVKKAIEAGLNVKLAVTPSRYLGEDALETIRYAREVTRNVSLNSAIFTPREETGRSLQKDDLDENHYIQIYKLLNQLAGLETKEIDEDHLPPVGGSSHESSECGLQCGGGRSGFVMDWKGTLLPCNRLNQIRAYPLKDGFKKAWAEVNRAVNSWPRVPECEGCAYHPVCNNCAATMLQYAEPGKQPIEMCKQIKSYVRHGVAHIQNCE